MAVNVLCILEAVNIAEIQIVREIKMFMFIIYIHIRISETLFNNCTHIS